MPLAHNTPIPTPTGWTTVSDLQIDDLVFNEDGHTCRVIANFSFHIIEPHQLIFSDEHSIVAATHHQWVTWTHAERKAFLRSPYEDPRRFPDNWPRWRLRRLLGHALPPEIVEEVRRRNAAGESIRAIAAEMRLSRISLGKHLNGRIKREPKVYENSPGPCRRTTEEIVASLTYGKRGDRNHCIPCTAPLELPNIDLPIPPYTLGTWLGNGSTGDGTFSADTKDIAFVRSQLEADGIKTTDRSCRRGQTFGTLGLYSLLREAGILNHKHVPAVYLRSSVAQRLALLQGLMDTDGNIENANTVAFVNTNKSLIDAVEELVHSLGMKTKIWSGVGTYNGKECKRFWRVQFTPTVNPFSLPRKSNALQLGGPQSLRNHHRMIIRVTPAEVSLMNCIAVDSINGMYLAGRSMIPTQGATAEDYN